MTLESTKFEKTTPYKKGKNL